MSTHLLKTRQELKVRNFEEPNLINVPAKHYNRSGCEGKCIDEDKGVNQGEYFR
jgi:hypothetical protein